MSISKQRASLIQDLIPDGVVCVGADNKVDYANHAFLELTGFSSADVIGIEESDLFSRINELRPKEKDEKVFVGCCADDVVVIELLTPALKLISCSCRNIEANDVQQGRVLFFHDITRELERDDRVKSEFLSVAAHKLRTPLVSILGFSELLLKRDFEYKAQQDALATIFRQATQFKKMLDDFLDIERMDVRHGKDFTMQKASIKPVIDMVLAESRLNDAEVQVNFTRPAKWPKVVMDKERIQQVLSNIIDNAVKFSMPGEEVNCSLVTRNNSSVKEFGFEVVDSGIGMSAIELERVGDRFYRADDVQSMPGGGLGIALSKRILGFHNGELILSSVKGEGTTATIWLPVA